MPRSISSTVHMDWTVTNPQDVSKIRWTFLLRFVIVNLILHEWALLFTNRHVQEMRDLRQRTDIRLFSPFPTQNAYNTYMTDTVSIFHLQFQGWIQWCFVPSWFLSSKRLNPVHAALLISIICLTVSFFTFLITVILMRRLRNPFCMLDSLRFLIGLYFLSTP